MASKVADFLRKMDIFERLSDEELTKIARLLKERKFPADRQIVQQGDPGDAMYIITEGRVKITITDQLGHEKVLAFLGEGQVLGDMALLSGAPRSATATASTRVRTLQLRKDDFDVLLAGNIELMKEMMRTMTARQALVNQRVAEESGVDSGRIRGLLSVVFSPRGGSGKSTIAANLAVALAEGSPDRVVLVDLDLLFGQQAVMLNLSPRTALASVTPTALKSMDRESFAYYLTTHDESSVRLLVGAARPDEGELVSGDHVRVVLNLLRKQFVHVVVDTHSSFSDATLAALEMADEVYLVATPELSTVRDLRECQRIFFELLGLPRTRFRHLLNRVSPYKGMPLDQVEQVLDATIAHEIPFGGDVPSISQLEGYPLVTKWPGNPTSRAILAVAADSARAAKEALAIAGR